LLEVLWWLRVLLLLLLIHGGGVGVHKMTITFNGIVRQRRNVKLIELSSHKALEA
jgi:hypothetical protein